MPEKELTRREIDALAGPALRTFFRIADLWSMSDDEQIRVLGIRNSETLKRWRDGDAAGFDGGGLERISLVLGVFKASNILLPDAALADRWIRKPNKAPLFGGRGAIELIVSATSPVLSPCAATSTRSCTPDSKPRGRVGERAAPPSLSPRHVETRRAQTAVRSCSPQPVRGCARYVDTGAQVAGPTAARAPDHARRGGGPRSASRCGTRKTFRRPMK